MKKDLLFTDFTRRYLKVEINSSGEFLGEKI